MDSVIIEEKRKELTLRLKLRVWLSSMGIWYSVLLW